MMHNETKNCQNCKSDFVIESDDFSFYEQVKVPAPTWCPECRMVRRLAFGNAWGVHFRNCDKCGDKTLTMYHPDDPTIVYCDPCWWSDEWDGTEYAMDYEPSRPFLKQWQELRMKTPHFAKDALYLTLQNCEYTNAIAFSKNCYMSFWADYCENVYYSSFLNAAKDSVDIFRVLNSELCYETVGLNNSSKTHFSQECDSCVDVWFSRNCYGCINCVGCANLRGKSYMIFNEQYSKEDYAEKLKELGLDTRAGLEQMQKASQAFWDSQPYREYTGNTQNLNVTGDYVFESKNAIDCYMCAGVEDCKYTQSVSVPKATNCMDYYGWGNGAELIYECAATGEGVKGLKFSFGMFANGLDSEYCGFVIGSSNDFGCVNLKRKKYCILNKEYSKEEYETLKAQIIEDMKSNPYVDSLGRVYEYGEFFPPEFSPYSYLDSNASKFFNKTKEQAQKEGFKWRDEVVTMHPPTIPGNDLPQTIAETSESILNEIVGCVSCSRGFKITKGEFDLYRKLQMPLPSSCSKCREKRRFQATNKPVFREGACAKCSADIYTAFPADTQKTIYCVDCYQQQIA